MEQTQDFLMIFFRLLGSLALLIFGMKRMSEDLQKMAGPGLRHILGRMTNNRFTGLLTGTVLTSAVQSSTATTVMTVSFVSAGLLTLAQSISVVMGANIGTTLTAWIMSYGLAGDALSVTPIDFVWPAFFVAMFLILYKKRNETVGDFIFALAFMFLGLDALRRVGADMGLGENEAVLSFFSTLDTGSYASTLIFIFIGAVLTMCVQSTAAMMALTMILCSSGVLSVHQGVALVLGENIGTTLTTNLAALTATTQARRTAFFHLFFNVFGVCWSILVFQPFVEVICRLVGYDGTNPVRVNLVLAAFHTSFNVLNALLLIGFIPQIERFLCRVFKGGTSEIDKEPLRLQYIDSGVVRVPEVLVLQTQKEVALFADRMQRMFGMVRMLFDEKNSEDAEKLFLRIAKYESIADNMEKEITRYLEQVSEGRLSDETKEKVHAMMRELGELESIGDSCYKLAKIQHQYALGRRRLTDQQLSGCRDMLRLVGEAMMQMCLVVNGRRENYNMDETQRVESEINQLRDQLRDANIADADAHGYDHVLVAFFVDFINECERLGDYVVNVVEARLQVPTGSTTVGFEGLVLDENQKTVMVDGDKASLTRTEYELLRLLLVHRGQVFSRQELITKVWPADVVVTDRTVDVCVTRLRKKISRYSSHIICRTGFGYCFEETAN